MSLSATCCEGDDVPTAGATFTPLTSPISPDEIRRET